MPDFVKTPREFVFVKYDGINAAAVASGIGNCLVVTDGITEYLISSDSSIPYQDRSIRLINGKWYAWAPRNTEVNPFVQVDDDNGAPQGYTAV